MLRSLPFPWWFSSIRRSWSLFQFVWCHTVCPTRGSRRCIVSSSEMRWDIHRGCFSSLVKYTTCKPWSLSHHRSVIHCLPFRSSLVTIQLCYLGMLLSSISDFIVVMVAMFQAVFHNTMICRVFRMMKLDSGTPADTMHTYMTPIAFDINGPLSQNSSLTSDHTLVSRQSGC